MNDWQMIPEIVGCNAALRMAVTRAMEAVEQGRHLVMEGEAGTGRRLLARSAWYRRQPGTGSLFTLDCRIFPGDAAEALLFGEHFPPGAHSAISISKFNLDRGGGLLLLHADYLPLKTQGRLAHTLRQHLFQPPGKRLQLMLTCDPSLYAPLPLHPELASLLRVHVPALRQRVEDIRAIAEAFLRDVSPFERVGCSQALIDKFCAYHWPGNISELRSVLRLLLLEPHGSLLDVRHLTDLMCRDERWYALLQNEYRPARGEGELARQWFPGHDRSLQ
jgi:DNA-binding NtrC family response regulator